MKQTILGSGGPIGTELAKALTKYTDDIRLVSRNPKKINDRDELLAADLSNKEAVDRAVSGSSIVYLTVGFPYSYKIWKELWPSTIENVLCACEEHKAKLVFFDNVYMYDKDHLANMTEGTKISAPSKKGEIRALIAEQVLNAHKDGKVETLIARSADFYGAGIDKTSMLTETVLKNLAKGSTAMWMSALDQSHSFTFTPDAGMATGLLGNTPDAFGEVWHLPTASNPPTGQQWIELCAKEMGKSPKSRKMAPWMVKMIGWFVPAMGEMVEMMYQFDRKYVFNSSKFEGRFGMKPTSYEAGIKSIVAQDYS